MFYLNRNLLQKMLQGLPYLPILLKLKTNLITFNQRYSQMTYDGYHFSQLGTLLNLSFNYKF